MPPQTSYKWENVLMDDLADLTAAEQAVDHLWGRLRTWCYRPAIIKSDVDALSDELRKIEGGLAAARKHLLRLREEAGSGSPERTEANGG